MCEKSWGRKMQQCTKPITGKIIKKSSKFWFVSDEKYYMVHFWDHEKVKKISENQEIKAFVFQFKVPQKENQIQVYGWVYPGLIPIEESTIEQKGIPT